MRLAVRPLAIFAASRVLVLAAMWLGTRLRPELSLADVSSTWDGGWYLTVAESGYPAVIPDGQSTLVFFPLYPLLVRLVADLPGVSPVAAGVGICMAAAAAGAVAVWYLTRAVWDGEVADRVVLLFSFFPGSFVLSMVYAEGIMIALAATCLWALVTRRWLTAGVLAALATASRPNAVALVAACAWASAAAIRRERAWRSLVAPLLAPAGIAAFFAFLWVRTGEVTAWFQAERAGWDERVTALAVIDDVRQLVREPFVDTNNTVVVMGTIVAVTGLVLLFRARVAGSLAVYGAVVVGLALVSETLGPRPRFVLTGFPVLCGLAIHLRGTALTTVVALSAGTLGALTLISVTTLLATP